MKPISAAPLARVLLLLAGLLSLQACETRAPLRPGVPAEAVSIDTAKLAEDAGEFVLAAREYEQLARSAQPPRQQHYQLKAVEALIKAAQVREARQKIQAISIAGLDASFLGRRRILEAQIAALEGLHEESIRLLNQAEETRNLDPTWLAEIYRVRAQAELSLNRPMRAARNLISRERFIVAAHDITQNQQQLWHVLETMSRTDLRRELDGTRDPTLGGWLELAILAVDNAYSPSRLASAVAEWKKAHAGHPVSDTFLKTLASAPPGVIGRVDTIALLLPLTSDYGPAAQAVRDGFLAMDATSTRPDKPTVRVYDIGADPAQAPAYYDQAARDGAQLIVGPLGLEAVDQVVRHATLAVPTLLLSHTTQEIKPSARHVLQFGLPPEQEATQAAERAYLDGHRHAALLYPSTAWGQRMAGAFTNAWQRLGGIILASQPYLQDEGDFSGPVKRLLNVTQSEARKERLETTLKTKLKFEARPREDIDMVFLAADAKRARLIKPQLNYHRAARTPVYATSHVFTGRGDPIADVDMDGILFGDMPWILVGDGKIQELRVTLQREWPYAHTQLDRLYALGVDAYAIIPQLNRISSDNTVHFSGVTSGLSLDRSGRLHRQLLWARFRKGMPELLDTFFRHKGQFEVEDGAQDPRALRSGG